MSKLKPSVDLGYPTEEYERIPAFHNIEEEAAFWDTHDVTEFGGNELQPVEVVLGSELADRLTVRLDRADRDALVFKAKTMVVGPSMLARMWLKERLREEAEPSARSR